MVPQLLIRRPPRESAISVGGSVDKSVATAFALALTQDVLAMSGGEETINLDFEDLELDDGSAVAEAVNALRKLVAVAHVVVHNAPQMLAHTLYKTGMLRGPRLALESPRNEEPTTT